MQCMNDIKSISYIHIDFFLVHFLRAADARTPKKKWKKTSAFD